MAHVLHLARRVDAAERMELDRAAVRALRDDLDLLPRLEIRRDMHIEGLVALETEALRSWPARKVSGMTPMPTRFERWMRSKLSAITTFTPSRKVPFAAQSRDEPMP